MARYDARPRGQWASEEFDEVEDSTLADMGFNADIDDLDALDAPPVRGGSSGTLHRRGHSRARKPDPPAQRSKGRQEATTTDVDEDLDLLLDIEDEPLSRQRDRKRVEVSEGFKCRHCRNFIGIPPSGGRNRNHCPLCLYSLHVDGKTPGDRASDCRSSMQPIGVFYRPKGEQMVVHRCLGCGFVRYNRIAADDNPIVLAELPVLDSPGPGADWSPGE